MTPTPAPEEQYMLEGPCPGLCKSYVLLRKSDPTGNEWTPVLYLRKPKHVTPEDYASLIRRMSIHIEVKP